MPRSLSSRYPPLVAQGMEIAPAVDTEFTRDGLIHFYLQVYELQQAGAQQPTVLVHLQIRDVKTNTISEQPPPVKAAEYAVPGKSVIPIASPIDIAKLAKGSYELQAQATDSTGASTPWRSAYFTVEK